MFSKIQLSVQCADITIVSADVAVFKHAQGFYGADRVVAQQLVEAGKADYRQLELGIGEHSLVRCDGVLAATKVLFIGVPSLSAFSYADARKFGESSITEVALLEPLARTIALTVHGPGFGLDEIECTQALLSGFRDAIISERFPKRLQEIIVVERGPLRAKLLEEVVATFLLENPLVVQSLQGSPIKASFSFSGRSLGNLAPPAEHPKKKIFVAMPFAEEMTDVWKLGIRDTVRRLGLVCERLDEESFVGDILPQIKLRIEACSLVIADLSDSNPNVILEVGYAWGKERPTLLLFRKDPTKKLPFDVRGQKCLMYKHVSHLQELLERELIALGFAPVPATSRD